MASHQVDTGLIAVFPSSSDSEEDLQEVLLGCKVPPPHTVDEGLIAVMAQDSAEDLQEVLLGSTVST